MSAITDIQISINRAVETVGPAVVGIGRGWRLGSGVLITHGSVLTNAHNLRDDQVSVVFADGTSAEGQLRGVDAEGDLAVVAVTTPASSAPVSWEPAEQPPAIGAPVFALANPGGRGLRASFGFVSGSSAGTRGPRGRRMPGGIEHTAPLLRGSSGGPLVDLEGRLIGINTLRLDGGMILALPADRAMRERVEALGRGESPVRRRLGVSVAPARIARRMRRSVGLPDRDGLLVREVAEGSPADRAGIERGDLIAGAGGAPLARVDELFERLEALPDGSTLTLTLLRGADERTVTVSFAEDAVVA